MTEEAEKIIEERQSTHGDFEEWAKLVNELKFIIRDQAGLQREGCQHPMNPAQEEAIEMILCKIGRIVCGNANHEDHYLDIAGYALLGKKACVKKTAAQDNKKINLDKYVRPEFFAELTEAPQEVSAKPFGVTWIDEAQSTEFPETKSTHGLLKDRSEITVPRWMPLSPSVSDDEGGD